jgi:hypothetical protein
VHAVLLTPSFAQRVSIPGTRKPIFCISCLSAGIGPAEAAAALMLVSMGF